MTSSLGPVDLLYWLTELRKHFTRCQLMKRRTRLQAYCWITNDLFLLLSSVLRVTPATRSISTGLPGGLGTACWPWSGHRCGSQSVSGAERSPRSVTLGHVWAEGESAQDRGTGRVMGPGTPAKSKHPTICKPCVRNP